MKPPSKVEEKVEQISHKLDEVFERTRIHYILFAISSLFVLFSIAYGQYFFQTFLTFMYSVYAIHIQLARKHEVVNGWKSDWKSFYHICLQIFFLLGLFAWIVLIFRSFAIF